MQRTFYQLRLFRPFEMFRYLICSVFALQISINLCGQRSEYFSIYKEMENLAPVQSPVFEEKFESLVQCLNACVLQRDCFSILRKNCSHTCLGFGNPFLFFKGYIMSSGTWHVQKGTKYSLLLF